MNSLHALWSLGAASGGALGAWAASLRVGLPVHLISATVVSVLLAAVALLLAQVPASLHRDPAYLFARAQWLRREDRAMEAVPILVRFPAHGVRLSQHFD